VERIIRISTRYLDAWTICVIGRLVAGDTRVRLTAIYTGVSADLSSSMGTQGMKMLRGGKRRDIHSPPNIFIDEELAELGIFGVVCFATQTFEFLLAIMLVLRVDRSHCRVDELATVESALHRTGRVNIPSGVA
jgi:hypothetical protein